MGSSTGLVWITGASSGLGRELALRLARQGRTVAITSRKREDLEQVAADGVAAGVRGKLIPCPLDIADADAARAAIDALEAEHGPIALAILNAGTHKPVTAKTMTVADFRRLIDVNVMGTVHCLVPVAERMIARKGGHIAVVSSVAGYRGLPSAAAYGLTKAGLINMCESLKPELEAEGVKLQLVNPGFVRTPLTEKNDFPMPFLMEVEDAARAFQDGLESSRFEIVFPWKFGLIMKIYRLLPYRLLFWLSKRMVKEHAGHDG